MSQVVNTGYAMKNNSIIEDASAIFNLADAGTLVMTKAVNKPGEFYVSGDTIVFTVTINLPATSPSILNDVVFEDQIPPEVQLPAAAPYGVTTTKGTIDAVVANMVKVSGLDFGIGETVTITITGTIV